MTTTTMGDFALYTDYGFKWDWLNKLDTKLKGRLAKRYGFRDDVEYFSDWDKAMTYATLDGVPEDSWVIRQESVGIDGKSIGWIESHITSGLFSMHVEIYDHQWDIDDVDLLIN